MRHLYLLSAASVLFLSTIVSAAVPTNAPSTTSAPVQGYFSQYFQNITTDNCNGTNVISRLNLTSPPSCTNINTLISNYITNPALGTPDINPIIAAYLSGFTPAPTADSVVQQFDGAGQPQYASVNTLIQNYLAANPPTYNNGTITYPGMPLPIQTSQWQNNGNDIFYNVGNVAVGTNAFDGAFHVRGRSSLGETDQNFLPQAQNWNYTLQLNGSTDTSIGFHDASQSVSSIRYSDGGFLIGADDGWGVRSVTMPGGIRANTLYIGIGGNTITTSSPLEIYIGPTNRMTIGPTATTVRNELRADGNLLIPSGRNITFANGSRIVIPGSVQDGRVLTSNGAGQATWQAPAAGGSTYMHRLAEVSCAGSRCTTNRRYQIAGVGASCIASVSKFHQNYRYGVLTCDYNPASGILTQSSIAGAWGACSYICQGVNTGGYPIALASYSWVQGSCSNPSGAGVIVGSTCVSNLGGTVPNSNCDPATNPDGEYCDNTPYDPGGGA